MIDGIAEVPSLQVLVNTNKFSLILVNKKMEKQFLFSQIACNVEKCFALTRCLMYRYWLLVLFLLAVHCSICIFTTVKTTGIISISTKVFVIFMMSFLAGY